ncbi:MAG TPA: hypothetical protein VGN12_07620 [Pirellulales bacterium]|jgi:hypothetical protein
MTVQQIDGDHKCMNDWQTPLLVARMIQVDPKPYLKAIHRTESLFSSLDHVEKFRSLMFRGNLFLMADRPSSAKQLFEEIERVELSHRAPRTCMLNATDNIARAIHAEDGSLLSEPRHTFKQKCNLKSEIICG